MDSRVIKYLPILSVYIIILGLINVYSYYSNFQIEIYQYISITEIGIILTKELFFLCLFSCIVIVLIIGYKDYANRIGKQSIRQKRHLIFLFRVLKRAFFLVFISTFLILLLINLELFLVVDKDLIMFYTSFFLLVMTIPIFIFRFKFLIKTFGIEKTVVFLFVLTTISLMLTSASYSSYRTRHGKYYGTIVMTSDSTYISTDSSFYIGKTQSYIFIHNAKDTSTISIPADRVIYLKIK